ncbi:MAG: (Fe-S)-binding protein [bacterium]|nr:(Fe-S)-binding protein [bacterium]
MQVSLFIPCLNEHIYAGTAMSMVKVLEYLGVNVKYVEDQTCCGQPAFNTGYRKEALGLAEKFIDLFADEEYVVAPSGSCVSMVRNHYSELDLKQDHLSKLADLKSRIFEFTEFIVEILKTEEIGGSFDHKVTYHDSCHLARELGIREHPRKLIRGIKNIEFIEMEEPDLCCGFGGTFSYKFKNISIEMVRSKCLKIEKIGAEYCIGADSSCLMNIEGFLRKNNMTAKTIHIADLLAESLNL